MVSVNTLFDRVSLAMLSKKRYESRFLRRRFADAYDIDIGDYSIGAFDRWRISPGTRIGRYCSIASSARIIDANHPTEALSTHPYLYLSEFGVVPEERLKKRPQVIEDDVWMGHGAIVTPGCHFIGRGAVIGAGAVVMSDVPRYAIVSGSPARVVRMRFPPDVIAAIEATRWWELDREVLARGLTAEPAFGASPSVDSARRFYAAVHGRELELPPEALMPPAADTAKGARGLTEAQLLNILRRERPELDEADLDKPLDHLGIDSLGFINLRVALETELGRQILEDEWGGLARLRDLTSPQAARAAEPREPTQPPPPTGAAAALSFDEPQRVIFDHDIARAISINMPQMALSGLSESWLFKELGDMQWGALTASLGTSSADIQDSSGARLYATFTRLSIKLEKPLIDFRENHQLLMHLSLSRFGAGFFFGQADFKTPAAAGSARLMTTFAKFGEAGKNTSLLKGQPAIPENCTVPVLTEMPAFGVEYRAQRAVAQPEPLWSCEYDIMPTHDINGVGLLYFAAYPSIAEVCIHRYAGDQALFDYSMTERDVFYFANATPSETLVFKIHEWRQDENTLGYRATINRKSDGVTMALVCATKVRTTTA